MCLLTLLSSHTALGVTFQTINTVTLCVLGFGRTKRLRTNYFINLYQMKDLLSLCAVFFFFFRWQTWGCTTVSTLYPISGPHYYYLTSPCPSLHCEHTAATIKDQFLSIWDWMTISYQPHFTLL